MAMMINNNDRYDEEDTPSKRESHFDQQRSSLRSDKSDSILRAHSRPNSRQRLDDFSLDLNTKTHTDRADSETLPSPSSPAPNVPYTRSRKSSIAKGKGRSRAPSSRGGSKSTPEEARRLEELLAPESWANPYELLAQPEIPLQALRAKGGTASNPPSRGSRTQQRSSRQPSFLSRLDPRAETPGSQLDITALPSMTAATRKPEFSEPPNAPLRRSSRIATEFYTISHLIFFALLGTLARLGLQALTFFPGAPIAFSELWPNVAGTFIIGFLSEDRRLFHAEWGRARSDEEERLPEPVDRPAEDHMREKARHAKAKKTIPLYIGLATGFCGSFTSFSSFVRDVFLALANDSRTPISHPYPPNTPIPTPSTTIARNGGYSFLALMAIIIVTISTCYSALHVGAHFALLLDPITPTLPFRLTRRFLDLLIVLLGWGCWIGAILLTVFPPQNAWRSQALFALIFAPLGCLARYYISLYLNPLLASFPLGTFTVNIFGTAVLGMAYDLQRVPLLASGIGGGSMVGCQVLQGIMDGFCGCLTTVSTWILEIDSLKKRHAYVYGGASVGVGLGLAVAIMGSVRWTVGWQGIICVV
ncbi:hypothetical protein CC86DRAFT_370583 [Ophiobolus disseminans]|uniref:Chromosome condensation protein-like protein n=1 Tax=Ophiobolus disseminans TaxID=1469910 RepID=A0A6A6ZYX0_9PLEO|nr:hypothetical protein CC86DRAFT_370583 [Ophiobolus disseminans]